MTSANPLPGDDRPLVDRFLRGRDETSFRALYRLHTPALFLLALRLVGNVPADAEDAVQAQPAAPAPGRMPHLSA